MIFLLLLFGSSAPFSRVSEARETDREKEVSS